MAPGIAEAIRAGSMAITKRAMLSRAVSAIRHRTLIINLPGSPKAVEESLGFVLDTLPHALGLARNGRRVRKKLKKEGTGNDGRRKNYFL